MKSNRALGIKTQTEWTARVRCLACLLLIMLLPEGMAQVLEGTIQQDSNNPRSHMGFTGTLVRVSRDQRIFQVTVRQATGEEVTVPFQNLLPASAERVLAWMALAARSNGPKVPYLTFSASKQSATKIDRDKDNQSESDLQTNTKSFTRMVSTSHTLTIKNSRDLPTGALTLQRIVKEMESDERVRSEGRVNKRITWHAKSEELDSMRPRQVIKMPFAAVDETYAKTETTRMRQGGSSGTKTSVDFFIRETKTEAVYLMAFDSVGNLIYFFKV